MNRLLIKLVDYDGKIRIISKIVDEFVIGSDGDVCYRFSELYLEYTIEDFDKLFLDGVLIIDKGKLVI